MRRAARQAGATGGRIVGFGLGMVVGGCGGPTLIEPGSEVDSGASMEETDSGGSDGDTTAAGQALLAGLRGSED